MAHRRSVGAREVPGRRLHRSGLLLACATVGWLGCASVPPEHPPARGQDARDSVWAAVLTDLGTRTGARVVLLEDSTVAPPRFGPGDSTGLSAFGSFVAELPPTLVADFLARNAQVSAIEADRLRALDVQVPFAVLGRAEQAAAAADPGAGVFRFENHPGAHGVVSLSRVGFSPDHRQALVHLVFQCGPRCGNTALLLLTRDPGGAWRVTRRETGITF